MPSVATLLARNRSRNKNAPRAGTSRRGAGCLDRPAALSFISSRLLGPTRISTPTRLTFEEFACIRRHNRHIDPLAAYPRLITSRTITEPGGLLSAGFQRWDFAGSNLARLRLFGQVYSYCLAGSAMLPIGKKNTCGWRQAAQPFVIVAGIGDKIIRRSHHRNLPLRLSNRSPRGGRDLCGYRGVFARRIRSTVA